MDVARFTEYRKKVIENCSKVIVGKEDAIQLVLTCFICGGHVLLEDIPGTGKTMLLRSFAKTIGSSFKRVQFTPDLLPSDLTGINFYNPKAGDFEFRPGPLFANIVLADEINRATPRTQSSLLEAMEERQITVDGTITDDELTDFVYIQEELEQISLAVEALQLWSERMLATGAIDREQYQTARANLLKEAE